ncbi:BTAD domain-containing putative transcriptional regulator [Euzebya sp.]|uniref:BTAD domain-containing putative transcriptional regulator n=1 Tax=Euzebya sp. TaxID=1971409 RepID=UPI003512CF7E
MHSGGWDDPTFEVLGPLVVRRGGDPLDVGGPKQRALLLALLIRPGQTVPADRLVDDLWGAAPPKQATASLQAYVSNLRRVLEPPRPSGAPPAVLVRRSGGYALDVDPSRIDAVAFARLVDRARAARTAGDDEAAIRAVDEALALWRGAPLADVADEPFAAAEVAHLSELRLQAIELRAEAALARGRHDRVVAELDVLVAADPLRERLRELLVVALYRSGRQADALARCREARELLADELGLDPGPELRRLEDLVLRQDPALDPPPPATTTTSTSSAAPRAGEGARPTALAGRDDELARLRTAWTSAAGGRGGVVLVRGDAGIGKSGLVEALATTVRDGGGDVRWGRCFETEGAPVLWPWVQVIRSLADDLPADALRTATAGVAPELALVVPELKERLADLPPPEPADPSTARFRLLDAISRTVVALGARRPSLVVLEDLHWADESSLDALRLLAGTVTSAAVLVVGTHRDATTEGSDALATTLAGLVRERGVTVVPLDPLDRGALVELARDALGQEPPADLVDVLHARSEGNPFYAHQLLALGTGAGLPAQVPHGVREIIQRRVAELPERTRQVLEAAAVVGRRFSVGEVARALEGQPGDVLDALDPAARAGLVSLDEGVLGYRFAHVLVRDALYESLPPGRRTRLHARFGEVLSDDGDRVVEVAHHFERAAVLGYADRAYDAALEAADRAGALYAFTDVAAHLDPALRLAGDDPHREVEVRARMVMLQVMTEGYTGERIRESTRRVRALAARTGEASQADAVAWGYWVDACVSADFATALDAAREHLDLARRAGDPRSIATGAQMLGTTCWHQGRTPAAAEAFDESIAQLDLLDDRELTTYPFTNVVQTALCHSAVNLYLLDRIPEGRARLDRCYDLAQRSSPFDRTFATQGMAYWGMLTWDASLSPHAPAAQEVARHHGFPQLDALIEVYLGWYEAGWTGIPPGSTTW